MTDKTATLREITDAIATTRPDDNDKNFRDKLYSRARTMRDRGLIRTANPRSQGREVRYSQADVAAAVVAINISLNGGSTGVIERINNALRTFDNTQGIPAFENWLGEIIAGVPIFIRFDRLSHPHPHTDVTMGHLGDLDLTKSFEWCDAFGEKYVITQSEIYPVTTLAAPVFASLFGKE